MIRLLMVLLIIAPIVIGLGGRYTAATVDPCLHGIVVDDSAELVGGGSRYKLGKEVYCKAPISIAHSDHAAHYGGSFFHAPNNVHHLELLYSAQCGAQVVLYNSYTQEVHAADQLLGMVRVISDDEKEDDIMRFLRPSTDGVLLGANIGPVKKPFEIEFYLQFPYRVGPDKFSMFVSE